MYVVRSRPNFLKSFLAGAALAAALFAAAPAADAGYLVVNNDEWTFSNQGFSQSPDASVFINKITNLFTGDQPGNFLAYSQNFGLNQSSLAAAVTGAGHSWTVSTAGPFNAAALGAYDAVFFAGTVGSLYPDQQVIIDYLQAGGNVLSAAEPGTAAQARRRMPGVRCLPRPALNSRVFTIFSPVTSRRSARIRCSPAYPAWISITGTASTI